jgi:soluble lytic murein transglycosylase-like protein
MTARPAVMIRLIDAARPAQPSAYDEESTMGPAQLLNRWNGVIAEASRRFDIPPAWIRAVMARESGGRTMLGEGKPIISRAGAVGLMQVLPETYDEMALAHRLGANPFDARDNILAGTAYLRWLHQRYGYPAMFAAYNAGPGKLEDHLAHGARLPAETRAYVGGITQALHGGKNGLDLVKFTRPDGVVVKIDPGQVTAIRAPVPGEFATNVKSVLTLGHHQQQAICEDVTIAQAAIRASGGVI